MLYEVVLLQISLRLRRKVRRSTPLALDRAMLKGHLPSLPSYLSAAKKKVAKSDETAPKKKVVTPKVDEEAAVEKKSSRNSFIVDEAVNDDSSTVALSKETMLKLGIYQVYMNTCSMPMCRICHMCEG